MLFSLFLRVNTFGTSFETTFSKPPNYEFILNHMALLESKWICLKILADAGGFTRFIHLRVQLANVTSGCPQKLKKGFPRDWTFFGFRKFHPPNGFPKFHPPNNGFFSPTHLKKKHIGTQKWSFGRLFVFPFQRGDFQVPAVHFRRM